MHTLTKLLAAAVLVAGLTLPTAAFAVGIPFGGRVVSTFYCLNGVVLESIVGVKGGLFVWTPATINYMHYQIRPGVYQLGLADVIVPCVVSWTPFVYVPGLRIQILGTSLAM